MNEEVKKIIRKAKKVIAKAMPPDPSIFRGAVDPETDITGRSPFEVATASTIDITTAPVELLCLNCGRHYAVGETVFVRGSRFYCTVCGAQMERVR